MPSHQTSVLKQLNKYVNIITCSKLKRAYTYSHTIKNQAVYAHFITTVKKVCGLSCISMKLSTFMHPICYNIMPIPCVIVWGLRIDDLIFFIYSNLPQNWSLIHTGSLWYGYIMCDIFGYYMWLQSDTAFYYPRLDRCSFSVGMFCVTCDVTRRPLGRLATACSLEGNVFRHGERGLVVSVLAKFLMGPDLSQIYERYHWNWNGHY